MTIADNPVTAIGKLDIPHLGKKRLGLDLDRLRQQFASPGAKHIRQGIINFVGLTKTRKIGVHGKPSLLITGTNLPVGKAK